MAPRPIRYSPSTLEAMHRDYADSRCIRLRNRLVEAHLNLVRQQAQRQAQRCNLAFDDLFQIGCMGLVAAVQGFEPSKGHAFSTYAVPLILGKMRHHLRDRHQPIRCSWRLRNLMAKQEQLQQQQQHHALQCTSLDAQNQDADGQSSVSHELVDARPSPEQNLLLLEIDEKISGLAPVDQRLVRGCWIDGRSQRELARELQLTPCRLSRRLKRLQQQLQQQLSAAGPWQAQLQ